MRYLERNGKQLALRNRMRTLSEEMKYDAEAQYPGCGPYGYSEVET